MASLIGNKPNQVPTNGDLGTMAFQDASLYQTRSELQGFRNRIINGDMRIDQRNAGSSVTPSNGQYGLDRWRNGLSVNSKFSIQQDSSAPSGFVNSTKATSLSAYSVGASEVFLIQQYVEGYNTADLAWGTASASAVTLSFWVRSSLTGTFGGALQNSDRSRCFPFAYTINSANTWEYKTLTVPGDTTGTWLTTTGIGIQVNFSLGTGASSSGTAGAWSSSTYFSATGATSVVGTNGATFYITGVQLEAGPVATPFERRPYGTELALCQRYYQRQTLDTSGKRWSMAYATTSIAAAAIIPFIVEMRTAPASLETNGIPSDYSLRIAANIACTGLSISTATTFNIVIDISVASGLTAGDAYGFRCAVNGAYLAWSAEL